MQSASNSSGAVHHRTAGTVKSAAAAEPAHLANKHQRTTTTTARRPKRYRAASVRSRNGSCSSDMAVAIGSTIVLTVIAVLVVLKVYDASTGVNWGSRSASRSTNGGGSEDESERLPFNPLYTVPDSFPTVGDRSDAYVKLRQRIDALLPPHQSQRSLQFVTEQAQSHSSLVYAQLSPASMDVHHSDTLPYDIYHCPETPPAGYPFQWPIVDLLGNWPVDTTDPPTSNQLHQALCVFDYQHDYSKAMNYRNAEVPFVVVNDPQVAATVERWQQPGYVQEMLREERHRTEYSENNHFMYYVPVSKNKKTKHHHRRNNAVPDGKIHRPGIQRPEGWQEPTKLLRMPYSEWMQHANVTDDKLGPDQPHWYYRLIGCGAGMGADGSCDLASSEYLFDELPFLQPKESLYIVEPEEQKGIHCRFGMKGVIAENHFDGSRNTIVVLGGSRRYILAHPNQCEKLALYPKGHPSARHSAVDWSNPNLDEFPEFGQATANEVVLTAGQVLYLPTEWFHFIVSLELNFQCNSRSGITNHYSDYIHRCGF